MVCEGLLIQGLLASREEASGKEQGGVVQL